VYEVIWSLFLDGRGASLELLAHLVVRWTSAEPVLQVHDGTLRAGVKTRLHV
jgi:hypothetical protein